MDLPLNTLIKGDCIDVLRTFDDNSIDSIITDPPYGIDFQSARRTDKSKWKPKIANDKSPYIWWLAEAFRVLKENRAMLCFTRYDTEEIFRIAMRVAGFKDKAQIIWNKKIHGMGDLFGDFAPQHENIIFATKGNFKFPNKRPHSLLEFQRITPDKLKHPNEKPVELMQYLCKAITPPNGIILDCFAGSSSTLLAAKLEGFNYIGIEKDENYCKISEERLKKYNF